MAKLDQTNSLSITRDFEATYHEQDLDSRVVVGERTGRDWLYFEGDELNQQIRIPREELLNPLEWR